MTEVQDRAPAALALVLGHDRGLEFAGALYRGRERFAVTCYERFQVVFDPREEVRVDDRTVLDHLGKPGL